MNNKPGTITGCLVKKMLKPYATPVTFKRHWTSQLLFNPLHIER